MQHLGHMYLMWLQVKHVELRTCALMTQLKHATLMTLVFSTQMKYAALQTCVHATLRAHIHRT